MSTESLHCDLLVIGAGPAGQKAAVQGAKAGKRVLLVEREARVGGECVHRGTIPSKALRHSAVQLSALRGPEGEWMQAAVPQGTSVQALMRRLDLVLRQHEIYMERQIERNRIERLQGNARFLSPHEVEIRRPGGGSSMARADIVVIATGSRPRQPAEVPIDHEHVLDSDSILSLIYLPRSLIVLGAGIIACEFASIFQALGVSVTMVDKAAAPLGFLEPELCGGFVKAFEAAGGHYVAGRVARSVELDLPAGVVARLDDESELAAEKLLCALGRVANLSGLNLQAVGLVPNKRGHLEVDAHCRTSVPHIYAAGDVIGPPALATSAMEQGRRAVQHAFSLGEPAPPETIPVGIYTIPELSCVGLTEEQARAKHGGAIVGLARFDELARGQIDGRTDGVLKLVADPQGRRILGAHILGEGATEMIHLAQLAIAAGLTVDAFIDNIFNFPTLAEGYRVAALDVAGKIAALRERRAA